jgi:hypothetical protein
MMQTSTTLPVFQTRSLVGVRRRLLTILGTIAHIAVLHWSYVAFASPAFSYMGFAYEVDVPELLVFPWLIAALPALWMPTAFTRPSQCLCWILFLMSYVPSCIVPWYIGSIEPAQLLLFDVILLAAFGIIPLVYRYPLLRIPSSQWGSTGVCLLVVLLSIVCYSIILAAFGTKFRMVALEEVYDARADYKDALAEAGRAVAYAVGWQSNAINPFLMAYGLVYRKRRWLLVGVLGQLLIYCITTFKSVLFSPIWLVCLWIAMQRSRRSLGTTMIWSAVALVSISTLVYVCLDSMLLASLTTRRLFLLPGLLTAYYFEFFSQNPLTLLADGIMRPFLEYPYGYPVAGVIGGAYFGDPRTYANASLWAYGYASLGTPGVLLFSALCALTMWLIDSIASGRDFRLATLMLALPAITLSNSSMFTCLLTHGLGLVMAMIYLLPQSGPTLSLVANGVSAPDARGGECITGAGRRAVVHFD